jgi:hypothetical protein
LSSSTAIKRALVLVLAAAALAPAAWAQWREEAAKLIGSDKQYAKAAAAIDRRWAEITAIEKGDAAALLAYCANRIGDGPAEIHWIVEYFETYLTKDGGFAFLDLVTQSDVIGYLNGWRVKFPWISGISLIKGVGDEIIMPEGIVPLVVETTNTVLYKFSENGNVLKAGVLNPGFNVLGLDANVLFLNSSRRLYTLEVRSANLILTKEITLDIDVSTARPKPVLGSQAQTGHPLEYRLTLFIDGKPVWTNQKTIRTIPLKIDVKPATLKYSFKPDYMLNRDKPNPFNSIDIVQAVSTLYKLLKDLLAKRKDKNAPPPRIETVQDLTLNFNSKDFDGLEYMTKISMKLNIKNLPYRMVVPKLNL